VSGVSDAPLLKTIIGVKSSLSFLSVVHDLGITANSSSNGNLARTNVGWVTILNLRYRGCPFPGTPSFLTDPAVTFSAGNTLRIGGQTVAPALEHLAFHVASGADFEWAVQCPGSPLNKLRRVHITLYYYLPSRIIGRGCSLRSAAPFRGNDRPSSYGITRELVTIDVVQDHISKAENAVINHIRLSTKLHDNIYMG
jgi:hypothetical protein